MCKPEKVQKKKISLTKLLVFRLCVNTTIKDILGFCWDFFFFMSRKAIFYSDIYTYVSILPKRKNLKGSLHWMWKHT